MVIEWLLLLSFLMFPLLANPASKEKLKLEELEVVLGSMAVLPCDLVPPEDDDSVALVIWYKNDDKTPIYSLDVRERDLQKGIHWADGDLEGRASFSSDLYQAALTLTNSRGSDSGVYKCRVDFKHSPTRNSLVNVSVIVPPEDIHLEDSDGALITSRSLGPLPEGTPLRLTCISAGGVPTPRVTWWYNLTLVDDTYDVLPDGRVQNVLTFDKTEREHLHAVLTCQALNSPFVVPKSTSVTIDLYIGPLDVRLLGENLPMSAGSEYEVACQTSGSKPPATLTWWKSGVPLHVPAREVSSIEGNVTTSTIRLRPSKEDHGAKLSCRATNPRVPNKALEASWTLDVYFVPEAEVVLIRADNRTQIIEGMSVVLECRVTANPAATAVRWMHNNVEMQDSMNHQVTSNNNHSLSLTFVTRQNSGQYSCSAENSEGVTNSSLLSLDVKYLPKCSSPQQRVFGASLEEAVNLTCATEANPPAVRFWWRHDVDGVVTNASDTTSVALAPGDSEVTVKCWAENSIGNQTEPCSFMVVLASSPEPPSNCSVPGLGETWLTVECVVGSDGGLPQTFEATVSLNERLVANVSRSGSALFSITGLEPGTQYVIAVRAINNKGASEEVFIKAATTGRLLTQRRTTSSESLSSSIESTIMLGVGSFVSCILVVSLLLGASLIVKRHRQRLHEISNIEKKNEILAKTDSCTLSDDDKNPDIIPCSTELTVVEVPETLDPSHWENTLVVNSVPLHIVNTQTVPCLQTWGVGEWEEDSSIIHRHVETQTPQNVLESVV
ncbi:nephrin-like [Macrosteles quadrilineatus]|uniref:nephrin-like n=1 Tax=Macrosteles quadrilineatus TaxID=74068 RepID=UPI0023E26978|nr:nephrin-like [Macrosteles quadrilineatus]